MRGMQEREPAERGVVSLIVTLVMMIVITLLVLGFAEVARNEQRSSLDSQLSTQAYYAAESGINDARAIINQIIAGSGADAVTSNNSCAPQGDYAALNTNVDATHKVAYTCLLINARPTVITHDIGYNSSVIPITSGPGGASFNTLTLKWTAASGYSSRPTGCYSTGSHPVASDKVVASAWGCNYPMVRVDLVDTTSTPIARGSWESRTTTVFFVPYNADSVSVVGNAAWGVHGVTVGANCTTASERCTATITGLSHSAYYMRVTTLYRDNATLFISGTDGGGASIPFVGVQATIDVTGRAQDVLRRVKVAADLTDANTYAIPGAAIEVRDSICKRFSVTSGSFQVYSDVDMTPGDGGNTTYCAPNSFGTPAP